MNKHYITLAQACALLQTLPAPIRAAAKTLGIEPTQVNFHDSFTEGELQQIAAVLRANATAPHVLQGRANGLSC